MEGPPPLPPPEIMKNQVAINCKWAQRKKKEDGERGPEKLGQNVPVERTSEKLAKETGVRGSHCKEVIMAKLSTGVEYLIEQPRKEKIVSETNLIPAPEMGEAGDRMIEMGADRVEVHHIRPSKKRGNE
jgi:hypothetical protein